ncbi:MAG: tetratricopeptide repeat protein [bacterium]|nr:tetratricopeptide repeat protein [bacterium]
MKTLVSRISIHERKTGGSFDTFLRRGPKNTPCTQETFACEVLKRHHELAHAELYELESLGLVNESYYSFKEDLSQKRGHTLSLNNLGLFFCVLLNDHHLAEDKCYIGHTVESFEELFKHIDRDSLKEAIHNFENNYAKDVSLLEVYSTLLSLLTKDNHPFGTVELDADWNLIINGSQKVSIERSSSFYAGRESEKSEITSFLNAEDRHFLLLTGYGGIGKSKLIDHVLEQLRFTNVIKIEFGRPNLISDRRLQHISHDLGVHYHEDDPYANRRDIISAIKGRGNKALVIFENIHTVLDQDILHLIQDLYYLDHGKVLLVSREIPKTLFVNQTIKLNPVQLGTLKKEEFIQLLEFHISPKGHFPHLILSEEEMEKIFLATHGHPHLCEFVLKCLEEQSLESILSNLPKQDLDNHEALSAYSNYFLNLITENDHNEEFLFLCYLSALDKPEPLEIISQLPYYKKKRLNALREQKYFIDLVNKEYFVHDLIADFAYVRIDNLNHVHQEIADIYITELESKDFFDVRLTSSIIHHLSLLENSEPFEAFQAHMARQFDGRRTKSFLSDSNKSNIEIFKTLITLNPHSAKYRSQLSVFYRRSKKWKVGQDFVETSLKIDRFKNDPYLTLELAKYQIKNRNFKKATDLVNAILQKEPLSPQLMFTQVRIELAQGNYPDAYKAYHECLKHGFTDDSLVHAMYIQLIEHSLKREKLSENEIIDKLNSQTFYSIQVGIAQSFGKLLFKRGYHKAAKVFFSHLLNHNPDILKYKTEYARAQRNLGEIREAETELLGIIKNSPDDNLIKRLLARLYLYHLNNLIAAENIIRSMTSYDHNYYGALDELLIQLQSEDDLQKIEDICFEIIESEYSDRNAYEQLVLAYLKRDQIEPAKKVLLNSPESQRTQEAHAIIAFKENDYNNAEKLFEQILDDFGTMSHTAYIDLASLYERTKRELKAISVLKGLPNNIPAQNKLAHLQFRHESLESARDTLLNLIPTNNEYTHQLLGEIYTGMQQWNEAIESFKFVLNRNPLNPYSIRGLARVYEINRSERLSIQILYDFTKSSCFYEMADPSLIVSSILYCLSRLQYEEMYENFKNNLREDLKSHEHIINKGYRKDPKTLISLNNVGRIKFFGDYGVVEDLPKGVSQQWRWLSKSNFLKEGDMVYYGIYELRGKRVVDHIEPYFEIKAEILKYN